MQDFIVYQLRREYMKKSRLLASLAFLILIISGCANVLDSLEVQQLHQRLIKIFNQ